MELGEQLGNILNSYTITIGTRRALSNPLLVPKTSDCTASIVTLTSPPSLRRAHGLAGSDVPSLDSVDHR